MRFNNVCLRLILFGSLLEFDRFVSHFVTWSLNDMNKVHCTFPGNEYFLVADFKLELRFLIDTESFLVFCLCTPAGFLKA